MEMKWAAYLLVARISLVQSFENKGMDRLVEAILSGLPMIEAW